MPPSPQVPTTARMADSSSLRPPSRYLRVSQLLPRHGAGKYNGTPLLLELRHLIAVLFRSSYFFQTVSWLAEWRWATT